MRALDLFCGVGGTGEGLRRAGFEVTGVDTADMGDVYPNRFVRTDAIEYTLEYGHVYDVIVAGPPCQHDCTLTAGTNAGRFEYPDLLEKTRRALQTTGRPFVIEQPPGRATKRMRVDLKLCGEMFGLGVIRHRNFEVDGVEVCTPAHPVHRGRVAGMRHGTWYTGPYFAVYGEGGGKGTVAQWQQAMGIDWSSQRRHLAEAIPPAYGEYLGRQIMTRLLNGACAPVA